MRRYGYRPDEWESEAYKQAGVKPGDMVEAFGYTVAEGFNHYLVLSLDDPDILIPNGNYVWVREQSLIERFDVECCIPDQIVKIL